MNDLYKVTDIKPTISIASNGQPIDSYEVFYETKSLITGKITVPVKEFTKENVHLIISAFAIQLEEVRQL